MCFLRHDDIPFLLQDGVDFLSKWLAQYAEQEEASRKTEAVKHSQFDLLKVMLVLRPLHFDFPPTFT